MPSLGLARAPPAFSVINSCTAWWRKLWRGGVKVACDLCGQVVEDALLQIVEEGNSILYACPECYVQSREDSPDEKA